MLHLIIELESVLEGELEATVADQVTVVGSGTSVFAPVGVKHKMINRLQWTDYLI